MKATPLALGGTPSLRGHQTLEDLIRGPEYDELRHDT